MPVVMMQTKYSFLESLKVDPALIEQLEKNQIKLMLGFYDVRLQTLDGKIVHQTKLPVSSAELMKNPTGQMGQMVSGAMELLINQMLADVKAVGKMLNEPDTTFLTKEAQMAAIKAAVKNAPPKADIKAAEAAAVGAVHAMQIPDIKKTMLEPPVKLAAATRMYQPVSGTSKSSRYYVIALGPSAKVAARVAGNTVSVRVEAYSPQAALEFSKVGVLQKDATYLSGHFELNPKVTPERALGAILLGVVLPFDTPLPKLAVLKGAN